ncbi:transcriptional regulator, TetR family [Paenibacillus sp. UNCCL117]|uniref:TetR family transcriptional regulator n=1 Tax=unclassified Paenibacillus TaxID=185978 RepID=UPI000882F815|nr:MULTISPECIES: TetR family transcriptional regulator [unclassified Paenibacillus]SDE41378.1 DNA-binding transcriptional regulator, AcrR family [Paenibacillus sp. cl123]SFW65475.1 transcriptional regulator, TetR family [Paenibacillus sp. UNCCL117]
MAAGETDVKLRILLAAKKLFARQGFDGTSIRQICEEAGANVALVSYHFGGKENLLRALFEQFFPGNKMAKHEAELRDPVEGLTLLLREIILFGLEDPELSKILKQEIELSSPRSEIVFSFTDPVWVKIRELLQLGREQRVFRFDSLDYTLMFVMGAAISYKHISTHPGLLTEQVQDGRSAADHLVKLVLTSLHAPGTNA